MIYFFNNVVFDTQRSILRRGDRPLQLSAEASKVLLYLVEHRSRVITKEELTKLLWPASPTSDTELASALRAVRQALGDSGRVQRLIQTVHRRGYRFIAPVTEVTKSSQAQDESEVLAEQTDTISELGEVAHWLADKIDPLSDQETYKVLLPLLHRLDHLQQTGQLLRIDFNIALDESVSAERIIEFLAALSKEFIIRGGRLSFAQEEDET